MALDSALTSSSTIPAGFEDLRGRAFQERYAISELVAASSRRVVFVGTEVEGRRPIVLVMVQPSMLHDAATLARFERRVRASTRVRHSAIGVPTDSGEALDGKLWLVFDRPDGEPLDVASRALPSGRLPWAEARPLLLELVRGLAAAHGRKVVHGSLRPSSCWVHGLGSDGPSLRVLELGANADPAGDEPDQSYSRTTTVGGDPVFMAPEAAGGTFGDERADAYLVGLVAWFMLVGRPPFQAANAFQLVTMHLQAPVPAMREAGTEVPAAVEAWVRALLVKEPGQRPASMTEIEQGILAIDELGEPRKVGAEELDKPRGRRGRAKASAASREEEAQRLGASEPVAGHGIGRRLPGQEIADPRAVVPVPAVARSSPVSPVAAFVAPGAASSDELERTLAFAATDHAVRPAAPTREEPAGTVMLTTPRAEPRAGALPDATVRLGHEPASSELPDATLMLGGAELASGGVLQPATIVLGFESRHEGPTATVALTADAMLAAAPGRGPEQAPTMLLSGGAAAEGSAPAEGAGQAATTVMGVGALGFEPRAPAPAQQGMQAGPASHMVIPSSQAPAFHEPPAWPPAGSSVPAQPVNAVVRPEPRSRLGLWMVIVTLVAAVAGVAVGLLLGEG